MSDAWPFDPLADIPRGLVRAVIACDGCGTVRAIREGESGPRGGSVCPVCTGTAMTLFAVFKNKGRDP
jgi:hypothetical protein